MGQQRPEQALQKALVHHLRLRAVPGLLFWHTPNANAVAGRRGLIQGGILKSMGVLAGVSDIVALYKGKFYALELKAPGGKATASQLSFIEAVKANGGYGEVAEGLDEALMALERWGLLRGYT